MSEEVEKRIVSLEFDGSKFDSKLKKSQKSLEKFKKSLNLDKEIRSFDELEKAADVDLSPLEKSIYKVEQRFTAFEMVALSVINRVTNKVLDMGEKMVKSLTIDNARTGWAKYEQEITAIQTLMSNVRSDIEAVNEESLFVNFNDDVQKMDYIRSFYQEIADFSDETSAGITESMAALGKFSAQGKDLKSSLEAVYGIYALTASAGRSISEGAQNAELFAKIAGRSLMAADMYSLSARSLNTPTFMELLLEKAAEGIRDPNDPSKWKVAPTLEKVEGGYRDISKGATSSANALMDVSQKYKNAMATFTDAASAFSGLTSYMDTAEGNLITLDNMASNLSSKWLLGDFVMEAVKSYGDFWPVLHDVIKETEEILGDERPGATTWSRALRTYAKAFKENGELVQDIDENGNVLDSFITANTYIDDAVALLTEKGLDYETARAYLEQLSSTEYSLSREAFLKLQEATKLSEALESARIGVSGRFSNIYKALFGDYLASRDLFTDMSEWLYGVFVEPMNYISGVFEDFSSGANGPFVWLEAAYDRETDEFLGYVEAQGTGFDLLKSMYSSIGPAIMRFVEPITEAFSTVFGLFDEWHLYDIATKLLNFFDSIAHNTTIFYTIQSVATAIFTVIKALGKALSSLWTAMAPVRAMAGTVMEVVSQIVSLLSNLVTSIFSVGEATTETGEKLSVFQPVVDALLYLFGIVKQIFDGIYNYLNENGVLNKIANALSQIFFTVSDVLAAIIYGIADAIGGLAQFLTESSFIQETVAFISAAFTKISEAVKNIISATKNAFISIFNAVKGFFSKIASGDFTDVKKIGTAIFNVFKLIIGGLTQMIAAGTADGTLTTFLKVLFTSIAGILKGTVKEFMELADAVLTNLYIVIATAWTRFKPLIADIINFLLSAVDFQFLNTLAKAIVVLGVAIGVFGLGLRVVTNGIRNMVTGIQAMGAVLNISRAIKFGNFMTPLQQLTMAVEDLGATMWERGKASKWLGFAAVITSFAVVIAAIVGAILLLRDVPAADLWKVVAVITVVTAVMGAIFTGMVLLMSRFGKFTETKSANLDKLTGNFAGKLFSANGSIDAAGSASQNTTGIGKVALIILGMAAFILAIGVAVGIMAQALSYAQKQGVGSNVIMGMLAMILGFMTLIMGAVVFMVAFADKTRTKASNTIMAGIGKKGLSGDSLYEWEGTGLYSLAAPILALAVLAAGIGFAMTKLAQAFKTFKANGMTTKEFMIVFGILSGVLVAIMGAMVFMVAFAKQGSGDAITAAGKGQYKKLLKIALIFSIFALGIGTIVGSIWLLSKVAADMQGIDMEPIGWLALAVIAIMAVVGGLMMLFKLVGWNQLGKIAAMMGIFTVSLASIVGSFWILGEVAKEIEMVDIDPLWKLVGIIGLFAGIITVLGIAAGVLSIWFAPIVTVIEVAIGVLSGLLVAISGSFLLGALALEHAADAAIKMGNNLKTIQKVLDYFVDVIDRLTTINTISGGNMSVAVIAVATAILILASAFAVFAASAWIFGKGLSAIAKGINDFNKTDFSGLKMVTSDMLETIQKFVDMAVSFTAAMAFLQLLSGGMAAIGILEVAAAIALVVTSVTSMIAVVATLIDVLSKLGDVDPFKKMMSKMDSLKTLLMSIVDVVMDVTTYALTKMVDTLVKFAQSGKVSQLGWALGEFGSQITVGTVGGTLTGLFNPKTWKNAFGKKSETTEAESKTGANQFGGIAGNIANFLFGSGNDYEGKYDLKTMGTDLLGDLKNSFGGVMDELKSIGGSVDEIKDQKKDGLDMSNLAPAMKEAVESFTGRGIDSNDTALLKSNLSTISFAIESATTVEELKAQAGALMKTTKRLAYDTTDKELQQEYKDISAKYDARLDMLANPDKYKVYTPEDPMITGDNEDELVMFNGRMMTMREMMAELGRDSGASTNNSTVVNNTINTNVTFEGLSMDEAMDRFKDEIDESVRVAAGSLVVQGA